MGAPRLLQVFTVTEVRIDSIFWRIDLNMRHSALHVVADVKAVGI